MDYALTQKQQKNNEINKPDYDVVIIGGGPAGSSAAIYASRSGLKTLIVDKGLTAGALGTTGKIVNYPGIPDEISGAELVEKMRNQAESFGAVFLSDKVIGVDLQNEVKTVFGNERNYLSRSVIIATGSMGRGNRIKGESELLGHGVSYCATCDAAFFRNQDVLVAGNNDEAIEEGLFLAKFVNRVFFLSQTPELKASQYLIDEMNYNSKIMLYTGVTLREIIGKNRVESVLAVKSDKTEISFKVSGVFVYLQGGKPITDFIQGQLEISPKGCLVVNHEYQTAIPGVFAIGDVLCDHVKQAVISAAEGAVAAMAVEKVLRGRNQMVVDWSENSKKNRD